MRGNAKRVIAALALVLGSVAASAAAVNVWQRSLPGTTVFSVTTAPGPALYVGVHTDSPYGQGVLKSTDDGQTWVNVFPGATYVNGLAADYSTPGRVYAATGSGLYVTENGGSNWTLLRPEIRSSITVSMVDPSILYADNWKSTDTGQSWTAMPTLPPFYTNDAHMKMSAANESLLWAVTSSASYYSVDAGVNWISQGYGTATIEPDPTDAAYLYKGGWLGTNNVRYFTGGSAKYLTTYSVKSVAIDPTNHNLVYAMTNVGAFKSTDFGAIWSAYRLGTGPLNVPAGSAVFDNSTGKLYAPTSSLVSTTNRGLWIVETRGVQTCTDADFDSFYLEGTICSTAADCNDNNPGIRPNATEICDGVDNDCDNLIDEGVTQTYYRDYDTDTWGITSTTQQACAQPSGYSYQPGDCNDANSAVNPGVFEICGDTIDNNCNGQTDCADSACSGTPACQCTAPGMPGTLTAAAAKRAITLNWAASSPAPATKYRVYRSLSSGGPFSLRTSVGPTTLTYKDTGLTTGTRYYYYVKAWTDCDADGTVDAGEESTASATVSATAK